MRASGLPWAVRPGIRMHAGVFSTWSHPDVHRTADRICNSELSLRTRPYNTILSVHDCRPSQYSLYSNELSITEPFYESSEEPN